MKTVLLHLALCLVAATGSARADAIVSILARTGQAATGFGGGATFSTFTEPRITPEGQVLFVSDATGTGLDASNNTGLFFNPSTVSLQLAARESGIAPGFGVGVKYRNLLVNSIARPGGRIGFALGITGTGIDETNDGVLFFGPATQLRGVAQEGRGATGTGEIYSPGWIFQTFANAPVNQRILANGAGRIAFKALLGGAATASDDDVLMAGAPTTPTSVAREGAIAPGCGGAVYAQAAADSLFIDTLFNGANQVFFRTALTGTGVTSLNNRALFRGTSTATMQLVARRGNLAPGVEAGLRYQSFLPQGLNDGGVFIFSGTVEDNMGATPANPNCVWTATGTAAPTLLLRQGQTAPGGLSPLVSFDSVLVNHSGKIAFQANLVGAFGFGNPQGIWVGTPAAFTLVAQTGMQAPGLPTGQKFFAFDTGSLQFNKLGEVAFRATIGPDSGNTVNSIWATDNTGALVLVLKEGDTISLGGTTRTVLNIAPLASGLTPGADEDGRTRALSDNDRLTFRIDASGPVPNQAVLVAVISGVPNDPPIAVDDNLTVRSGIGLKVLANDSDPNGDPIKIVAVTQGAEGRVSFSATAVNYAPSATFDGTDTFTYTISDGRNGLATATVTITNPFVPVRGTYVTDVTQGGTKVGTISVSVGTNGAVHGRLVINGKTFVLNGSADFMRVFTQTFRRTGLPDLVLTLNFDTPGGAATLSGGATGDAMDYVIVPVPALLTHTLPDAPAGRYNFRLPGTGGATEPHGTGWLSATLSSNARLRVAGVLPDGTSTMFASQLRSDATALVNAPLYRNPKGSFSGKITFSPMASSDATATFRQVKPMQVTPTPLFNGGFDIMINSDGQRFIAPVKGMRTLSFPTNPLADFSFSEGDLAATIMQTVRVATNDAVTIEPPTNPALTALTFTLNRSTGLFSGTFTPTAGTKRSYRGVILIKTNEGSGIFTGTTQTGTFSYKPQP
jgi:hypothetical protein